MRTPLVAFLVASSAAIAVGGCKRASGPALPTASADAGLPDASPAKAAAASPADAGSQRGHTRDAAELAEQRLYLDAMRRGRDATAGKSYASAVAAFDDALKHAPKSPQALGERGYAKFLAKDLPAAEQDLEAARDVGPPPRLAAQIWFNLGLVREQRGDADGALSAFATSEQLSHSSVVTAKIDGRSTCTAEVATHEAASDLAPASSWDAARTVIDPDHAIDPNNQSALSAKDVVCTQAWSAVDSANSHDACNGDPPWLVSQNYAWFFHDARLIFPARNKSMWITEAVRTGSWPAHCTGASDLSGSIDGDTGTMVRSFDGSGAVVAQDGDDVTCGDGPGWIEHTFYDLKSGRALARVRRNVPVGARAPDVELSRERDVVTLSGGGCRTKLALR